MSGDDYVNVATSERQMLVRRASGLAVPGGGTAPVNTVLPVITGTPTVGQTLTANPGTWTGTAPITYAYQWKRAGVAISSATALTYLLQGADQATLITITETATNSKGSASATSAAVGPIAAAVVGGAALLAGETDGFAADFLYANDANRVAVKTASVVTEYGLDAFFLNAGTSAKLVYDVAGNLVWSPHNLLLRSEDFTSGSWVKTGTPIVTAHSIEDDDPAGSERMDQGILSAVVGQNYTISIWLLKDAVTTRFPYFNVVGSGAYGLSVNTSTGATSVPQNTYVSASHLVEDLGTHWKVKITFVAENTTTTLRIYPAYSITLGGGATNTAVGLITIPQVQWNRGPVPTAYLATAGVARYGLAIDYDPVTHALKGLLCEQAVTNLILNNAAMSTQSCTVTAAAHALSFWGTGTVTLSGVSTAGPLVGTGVNNRVSLTFTPTAGSLTLTVSGTVSNAQLETGTGIATSLIPTFAATVTRSGDAPTVTPASINHSATAGSWWIETYLLFVSGSHPRLVYYLSTAIPLMNYAGAVSFGMTDSTQLSKTTTSVLNSVHRGACAFQAGDRALTADGLAPVTDTGQTTNLLAPGATIYFGSPTAITTGYIRKLRYVPRRKSNTELTTETA